MGRSSAKRVVGFKSGQARAQQEPMKCYYCGAPAQHTSMSVKLWCGTSTCPYYLDAHSMNIREFRP